VDDRYYYGLNPEKLANNDYWLIVIIQAASYCELHQIEYIRYNRLRENSDDVLKRINKQRSGLGGGSFKSIIKTCSTKGFLVVEKISKKETRIYPNIPLIKKEVEAKKIENLAYGNKRIIRIVPDAATVQHHPKLASESVQISESLIRQTSKTRSLSDSIQVSDRLGMVVTRANPKKGAKQHKHIFSV
jgi:hypothetical protein